MIPAAAKARHGGGGPVAQLFWRAFGEEEESWVFDWWPGTCFENKEARDFLMGKIFN